MQPLLKVLPNPRRLEKSYVRPQWFLAIQVPHLQQRLQQTNELKKPPFLTHRLVYIYEDFISLIIRKILSVYSI